MRIAFVTQSYPPMISGAALTVQQLAAGMAGRGQQVLVLAASDRPQAYTQCDGDLAVVRIGSHRNPFRSEQRFVLRRLPSVRKELEHFRPDLIHLHEPLTVGLVGLRSARRLNVPCVLTMHQLPEFVVASTPLPGAARAISDALLWRCARWFTARCAAVIAPTETVVSRLAGEGIAAQAIGCAVNLQRFSGEPAAADESQQLRGRYGLHPRLPVILHAGRLDKDKSVERVLRAAALALRERDAQLLVVGDGVERRALMAEAGALGIAHRCCFTGFVEHERDLPGLFRLANIFVTASQIETFGLVCLEAMASALPIVAPRATCLPELVADGHTGLLAAVDDVPGLAAGIIKLLDEPETAQRMGRAGRRKARCFTIERMLDQHMALYERLTAAQVPARYARLVVDGKSWVARPLPQELDDGDRGGSRSRKGHLAGMRVSHLLLINAVYRLPVHLDGVVYQVDQPVFSDAGPRIERPLNIAVVGDGRVGDLDAEQHIGGCRQCSRVIVVAMLEQDDVRLRLRVLTKNQRVLDAD